MTDAEYNRWLDDLETELAASYLADVRQQVAAAWPAEVEKLVERGDSDGVSRLFEAWALVGFLEAMRRSMVKGGQQEAKGLGRGAVTAALRQSNARQGAATAAGVFQYNPNGQAAAAWLTGRSQAVSLTAAADQRDAVRAVVRAGMARGQTVRQTTLDIVGRVSPQTGRRTGGVIGLAGVDATYAETARDQLLSGQPAQMRAYLQRQRRDRRFDATVRAAIAEERRVARQDVERIVGRYSDRLLESRARMLAQTEALASFNAGRMQVYEQLTDQGVNPADIRKVWRTRGDKRVRDSHREMNGQTVAMHMPFRSGLGALLLYPGDQSLGAGWGDVANCRCNIRVSFRSLEA